MTKPWAFNFRLFWIQGYPDCIYGRRGASGPGLMLTRRPPLFSERYGHRKPMLRLGAWRLFRLEANQ